MTQTTTTKERAHTWGSLFLYYNNNNDNNNNNDEKRRRVLSLSLSSLAHTYAGINNKSGAWHNFNDAFSISSPRVAFTTSDARVVTQNVEHNNTALQLFRLMMVSSFSCRRLCLFVVFFFSLFFLCIIDRCNRWSLRLTKSTPERRLYRRYR